MDEWCLIEEDEVAWARPSRHQPQYPPQRHTEPEPEPELEPQPRKQPKPSAFDTPANRVHGDSSFPDRLRASMPSRRPATVEVATSTDVVSFTRDMGAQTDASLGGTDRILALQSALQRSLDLSMALKAKTQDAERLELQNARLQDELAASKRIADSLSLRVHRMERGLAIARDRQELAATYQDSLQRDVRSLRAENSTLQQQVAFLSGGLEPFKKSVSELEELEDALQSAMLNVRAALRAKYRAAMAPASTAVAAGASTPAVKFTPTEKCVVCLERPTCVRLEPCGHEVLCSHCALRVSSCPVDRVVITDHVLTHGLNAYLE
ncbi:hypothetical protein ATCC90586_009916 [Pythium insidiosum]|nr:hypothetical protein ATCC90586_009916 [Pythium insidiosum]